MRELKEIIWYVVFDPARRPDESTLDDLTGIYAYERFKTFNNAREYSEMCGEETKIAKVTCKVETDYQE